MFAVNCGLGPFKGSRASRSRGRDAGRSAVVSLAIESQLSKFQRVVSYLPESFQALLLGVGVDVGSNEESDNVEEGHPGVLGEELLSEGQAQGRGDPADLHDGHESSLNGRANLVDGARTGDNSHRGQVDAVLDGGDLGKRVTLAKLMRVR